MRNEGHESALEACPSRDRLRLLHLGSLPGPESESLTRHLNACPGCQAAMAALASSETQSSLVQDESLADRAAAADATIASEAAGHDVDAIEFLSPPVEPDEIGRLGSYRILRVLGKGGMGIVFLAHDPSLDRPIALKAMLPKIAANPAAKERFLREARAAAKLKSDHIVTIHQVGEASGIPFIALEFLEGVPINQLIATGPRPTIAQILRIGREAALGLATAHDKGLIHRDIKPANLWLEKTTNRVKVLDFGLARSEKDDVHLTQTGAIVGTPAFMSPEQARGEPMDGRSDLFSLGCVLYCLCTGDVPFRAETTMGVLMALAMNEPTPPHKIDARVPASLSELVLHLLRKDPKDRPPTARDVVQRIERIESELAGTAPAKPGRGPSPWVWAGLACVAAALLVVAAASFLRPPPDVSVAIDPGPSKDKVDAIEKPIENPPVIPPVDLAVKPPVKKEKEDKKDPVKIAAPAIDLLPLIDLKKDVVHGSWSRSPQGEIVSSGKTEAGGASERIEIPYTPPAEYDFIVEFTRQTGNEAVTQIFPTSRGDLAWIMAGWANAIFGFDSVNSQPASTAASSVRRPGLMVNGRRHQSRLEVRKNSVTAFFDGKQLSRQDLDDAKVDAAAWKLRTPQLLGLGSFRDVTVFHKAELVEIGGAGKPTRPTPKPPDVVVKKLTPDPQAPILDGHTSLVWGVRFLPDGLHAASAAWDGTVRIWDVATGKEVRKLTTNHNDQLLNSLAVSPDGKYVAAGAGYAGTFLWGPDKDTPRALLARKGKSGAVHSLLFTPNSERVIVQSDGVILVFRVSDGGLVSTTPAFEKGGAESMSLHPDQRRVVMVGVGEPKAIVWNLETNEVRPQAMNAILYSVLFDRDGRRFFAGTSTGRILIHDLDSDKNVGSLTGHAGTVRGLRLLPGDRLLSSGQDNTIRIWDLRTNQEIDLVRMNEPVVNVCDVSPDGRKVVAGAGWRVINNLERFKDFRLRQFSVPGAK